MREIFLTGVYCWSETRECLTYDSVFVPIETIDIERLHLRSIETTIVWCNLICTHIIFCLSRFLCGEVGTIEIIFGSTLCLDAWSHQLDSIFGLLYTRLGNTLARPEWPEIEIVVKCLDTDCCEEDDTETDRKCGLDLAHPPEYEENDTYSDEEPETSRLGIASFFSFLAEFLSCFTDSRHRYSDKE